MKQEIDKDILPADMLAREEHIDNYLNDIMTDEELEDFEAQLNADQNLAEDVDFARVVANGVRYNAFKDMLGEMKDKGMLEDDSQSVQAETAAHCETTQSNKGGVIRYLNRALAAACVIGVIGIAYFGVNEYQSQMNTEMNATIASDRIASFDRTARGGETPLEKAVSKSQVDNGNEALTLIAELEGNFDKLEKDADVDKESYEYRQAKIEYDEAQYLKALLLIKQGKTDEARKILCGLQEEGYELNGLLDRLK